MGLCRRVSYETLHEHGSEVAYQVRRGNGTNKKMARLLRDYAVECPLAVVVSSLACR